MTRYVFIAPHNEVRGDVELADHYVSKFEERLGAKAYLPFELDHEENLELGVMAAEAGVTKAALFRQWIEERWAARAEVLSERIAC